MKKNSSTGNLFNKKISRTNSKLSQISERITKRSKSSKSNKKKRSNSISNYNLPNLISSYSTFDLTFSNNNCQKQQLYEEVIKLKQQINNLYAKISLIKSDNQKKEGELLLKEKEIDNFFEDNKNYNNNLIVNIEKLEEANLISKLKKEYFDLKKIYSEKEIINNELKTKIKNAKLFNSKILNEDLQKQLINIVDEYNKIQKENSINEQSLKKLSNLSLSFNENHIKIQNLQYSLKEKEKNLKNLKEKLNELMNIHFNNIVKIKKQNINKLNLNKQNDKILNEKKSIEENIKMKSTYERKIKELNDKLKEYKNKCQNNELIINQLKKRNEIIKKETKKEKSILEPFNYKDLVLIEKNPNLNQNQKIVLLKSLVNESVNKRKELIKNLENNIEKIKALGYDIPLIENEKYSNSENNIEEDKSNINNIENNKNNEKENENEINKNKINVENNKNNEKENENEINKNKINIENNKNIENENEINNIKTNNKDKIENNENNENNNNNIFYNESNSPNETNEKITPKYNNQNNEEEYKKLTDKIEEIKEEDNKNINSYSILTNDDFTEFTYVLIKNFESKKINEEKAKELIIDPLPKDIINHNEINNIIINKIKEILYCSNKDDIEKINKWINTLYMMCNNDQINTNENFLSLFSNIKIYKKEEELKLKKKVKKYLLPYKEILKTKLNSETGFISFLYLKKILEEQKIDMKDDYAQFLFYQMKQFDNKNVSLYDLKVENLFEILDNTEHDSKMNSESDIEISNDEYIQIITNFILQLSNILIEKNTTLRNLLKDIIQNVQGENLNEKLDIILIDDFINKMKQIGIEFTDLEIYCLFSRYKISDNYEVISVDLIEKELENLQINNFGKIQSNNIGEKVMENVEEENEENTN